MPWQYCDRLLTLPEQLSAARPKELPLMMQRAP
jgi:hypothetical protein